MKEESEVYVEAEPASSLRVDVESFDGEVSISSAEFPYLRIRTRRDGNVIAAENIFSGNWLVEGSIGEHVVWSDTVFLEPGAVTTISPDVSAEAVSGTVVDSNGHPVSGATVALQTVNDVRVPFRAKYEQVGTTSEQGEFTIDGLIPGQPLGATVLAPGEPVLQTVFVPPYDTSGKLRIKLGAEPAFVDASFELIDRCGNPLSHTSVKVTSGINGPRAVTINVTTDANGRATVPLVPKSHAVVVVALGEQTLTATIRTPRQSPNDVEQLMLE